VKLGLITQIRNEIEILQPFLNHIDGLFDVVMSLIINLLMAPPGV